MNKNFSRTWAFNILWQVMHGKRHLQNLLEDEFRRNPQADSRDKAFCHNLLYVCLRNWLWLQFLLSQVTRVKRLQNKVLYLLLLAAAEVKFMRTPDYAALSAWVDVSRALGLGRASALVNATLRALTRMDKEPEIPADDPVQYLSIKYSHPAWLVGQWLERFEDCEAWLRSCQEQPRLTLRVNTLKTTVEDLMAYLRPHADSIDVHALHPWCLALNRPVQPLPGFQEGLWQGQDAGAAALSELLGVKPGSRVLDMCAGAGGKSGHLAQLMQNQGQLLAVELTPGRGKAWQENMQRMGVSCARLLQQDARALPPDTDESFDYILLDAPCSGLGTTGRRPDVRWRRQPQDSVELAGLQKQLLTAAVKALKPGGVLLYATCTGIIGENEDNINWLLAKLPQMRIGWNQSSPLIGNDNFWRTYPRPLGCDGFFAARLIKE